MIGYFVCFQTLYLSPEKDDEPRYGRRDIYGGDRERAERYQRHRRYGQCKDVQQREEECERKKLPVIRLDHMFLKIFAAGV